MRTRCPTGKAQKSKDERPDNKHVLSGYSIWSSTFLWGLVEGGQGDVPGVLGLLQGTGCGARTPIFTET